jgi:hypothetical protein
MANDTFDFFTSDLDALDGGALATSQTQWISGARNALWVPTSNNDTPSRRTAILVTQNTTGGLFIGRIEAESRTFEALSLTPQTVDAFARDQPLANPTSQNRARDRLRSSIEAGVRDALHTLTFKGRMVNGQSDQEAADNPFQTRPIFRPDAFDIVPRILRDTKDQAAQIFAKKDTKLERTDRVTVGNNTQRLWNTPDGPLLHTPLLTATDRAQARRELAQTLGTDALAEASQVFAAGQTPVDGIQGVDRFGSLDPVEGARWDAASGLCVVRLTTHPELAQPTPQMACGETAHAHSLLTTFTSNPALSPFVPRVDILGHRMGVEPIYTPALDIAIMGGYAQQDMSHVARNLGPLAPAVLDAHARMAWEPASADTTGYTTHFSRTSVGVAKGLEQMGGTPKNGWADLVASSVTTGDLTLKGLPVQAMARFMHRTEIATEHQDGLPNPGRRWRGVMATVTSGFFPPLAKFEEWRDAVVDNLKNRVPGRTPEPSPIPTMTRAAALGAATLGMAQEDGIVPHYDRISANDLHAIGVRAAFLSTPNPDMARTPVQSFVDQAPDLVRAWGGDPANLPTAEALRKGMVDRITQDPDLDKRLLRHQALAKAMSFDTQDGADSGRLRQKALFAQAMGVPPSHALQAVLPPTREEKRAWAADKAKKHAHDTAPQAPAPFKTVPIVPRKRASATHETR